MGRTSGIVLQEKLFTGAGAPPDEFKDLSKHGNDGVHTDITWERQPRGIWMRGFDAAPSFVNCGNDTSLRCSDNITAMAWVRTPATFQVDDSGLWRTIEGIYNPAAIKRVWIFGLGNPDADGLPSRYLFFAFGDPADGTLEGRVYVNEALVESTIYHFMFTFTGGTLVPYINNQPRALTVFDGAVPASLYATDADYVIGANAGGGTPIRAHIACCRFYSRVLTEPERTNLWNSQKGWFGYG